MTKRDDFLQHWGMPGMKWKKHKKKKNDDDVKDKLRSLIKKAKSRAKSGAKKVVKAEHKVEKTVKAKVKQVKKNHEARKKQKKAVEQLSKDLDKAMKGTTRNPMVLAEEKAKAKREAAKKPHGKISNVKYNSKPQKSKKEKHGKVYKLIDRVGTKIFGKAKNKETITSDVSINGVLVRKNGKPVKKKKSNLSVSEQESRRLNKGLTNKQKRARIKKLWKGVPNADFKDKLMY